MNQRWDLDALYTSFESKEFQNDFSKTDAMLVQFSAWVNETFISHDNEAKMIADYIKKNEEISMVFFRLGAYSNLRLSTEAKNTEALTYSEKIRLKLSDFTQPTILFEKWLGEINNLSQLIESSKELEPFRFYLIEIAENNKFNLSEKEEIIISKMQTTGSSAWSNLQNLLSSTLMVDITLNDVHKTLPISVVRNMAFESDQTVRKTAYEAELKAYKKIEESSAAALNAIKGEVTTLAKMRGFESPLHMTLHNSRMDKETLDAMMTAVKESLPAFRKYFRKKAEILSHKNGLPFYDLFATIGDTDKSYSYEEAHAFIVEQFGTFSKKLADLADKAFTKHWIDAEPRDGKRGGAFCSNLRPIKESRILTNFNGKMKNVTTLAHELGHAYHGDCIFKEHLFNSQYTMPVAETASIFCETIVGNAVMKNASAHDLKGLLESELADQGQTVVDIYSRYLFESELFERRKDASVHVEQLKEMMLRAQKEAYGDGLDHECLHPYMWANKPHYYTAGNNFYNFPYTFGLLFAKGLYAIYQERGDAFVAQYDTLLQATGKNSIADAAKIVKIDVRDVDFWRRSLKLIEKNIETFISL